MKFCRSIFFSSKMQVNNDESISPMRTLLLIRFIYFSSKRFFVHSFSKYSNQSKEMKSRFFLQYYMDYNSLLKQGLFVILYQKSTWSFQHLQKYITKKHWRITTTKQITFMPLKCIHELSIHTNANIQSINVCMMYS